MPITIDFAIEFLQRAKAQIGGDKCLVISLTDSELDDVSAEDMGLFQDDETGYVEISATQPSLRAEDHV